MSTQNGLNVRSIVSNMIILFGSIYVIRMIIGIAYGFVVGFQTRGDAELITQGVIAFGNSVLLLGILALVAALLAFWRGRMLPMEGTNAFVTLSISLAGALVLLLLVNLIKLDSYATATAIRHLGAIAVGGLAGGYVGTMMRGSRATA